MAVTLASSFILATSPFGLVQANSSELAQAANSTAGVQGETLYESVFRDSYLEKDGKRIRTDSGNTDLNMLRNEVGVADGTSWVYEEVLSVRDAITREEVDQINIDLRVDLFLQDDATYSGVIESASGTPLDLDFNCELRQDRSWQPDISVGNFDCSTLAMQQTHYFHESSLPAAKFGDGKYFTEFTYNITSLGQTPSGEWSFQSRRYTCKFRVCLY